jgi:predicted RNA-binding Zn-ribbon protein involved in translation (DUF1610 family)
LTAYDDEHEWEAESDDYADDEPEGDQLPCPSCGEMVYDDTDRCPHCGDWIMPLEASTSRKSTLWIIGAVLALIGLLIWIIR